jgi:hypothetical protein
MNWTLNNNVKNIPQTRRALTQMVLIAVQLPCILVNTPTKFLRALGGRALDLPPSQSAIVDAEQCLQEALHSLDYTHVTAPPPTMLDAPMGINGDTSTVRQTDVDGLGEFVNMRKTPNA